MATQQEKWEVVNSSKPGKKAKNGKVASTKTNKKTFYENAPKIEIAAPVKESPTIYQYLDKDKDKKPAAAASGDSPKPTQAKQPPGPKKQPGTGKPSPTSKPGRQQPPTLEQAMKTLDASELQTILANDKETFPNNPSVWLKDMASLLILHLDKVPESDPVFADQPHDYPVRLLPKPVHSLLKDTLIQCSSQTLELFLEHCIQTCINDIGKGTSTYGIRVFIQLLAFNKPQIIVNNLPKYLELVKSQQNRPLRCLSIMWAVGQAGHKNLANGLKVWLDVMLPVLNMRSLSTYAIDYLTHLFESNKDLKSAYDVISVRHFFHTLDIIFKKEMNLSSQLQKKLSAIYPRFKAAAYGSNPGSNLRNFFPSYLARLTGGKNQALETEVLNSLVDCLSTDKHSFSVWRQMYTKHLHESGLFLQHLNKNWNFISKQLDKKILKETIQGFSITNDELLNKQKSTDSGLENCVSACKEIKAKMSVTVFPWRTILLMIFTAFLGLIVFDSYSSGGFKKSKTAQVLHEAGLLAFLEQVWLRVCIYAGKALDWLYENVPYYYGKMCEAVGPYIRLFWTKLYATGVQLEEVTRPHRAYLMQHAQQLLQWVYEKTPWLWAEVSHYASLTWEYVVFAAQFIWQHIITASAITKTWLQENVFTDKSSGRL